MTCDACTRAKEDRVSGYMRANCDGCIARALARSPAFAASAKGGKQTPEYKAALARTFPGRETAGHELAKEWAALERATA